MKPMLMGAVLLIAMVLGSASAAVVVASIALRPAKAAQAMNEKQDEDTETDGTADGTAQPAAFEFEEPLIVNVRETQQRRFLSAKPVLVVADKKFLPKLQERQVEMKHMLITILKSKTLEQLDDPQIANTLGREVQEQLNAKLDLENAITKVHFTQLVVQ